MSSQELTARHLFDGIAPSRKSEMRKKMATEDGEDRLGSLPDGPLQHVMSFLPSRDAVRTSVLARRWRDLWKSLLVVRVMESQRYESANEHNEFINYVLLLRDPLPLDEVEIKSYDDAVDMEESFRYIEHWVRYAFLRKVKALRLCIMHLDIMNEEDIMMRWQLPDKLLTSSTLVKLELTRVESMGPSLDFSSCPLLKDLKMEFCDLFLDRITSPSLAHLIITYCYFLSGGRTRISTPNLVSLQLVDCRERTPLLESMPKLVSAFVRLRYSSDCCDKSYEIGACGDDSCKGCHGSITGNSPSILLKGLSCAANLELTAEKTVFIFRRDLMCCPVFSKLKTLLLNDWCLIGNLDALACFLQRSPTLEKLILQLPEVPEDLVEKVGIYVLQEQPLTMEHLTVEIKCHEHNQWIHKIVEVLSSYGIPSENIKIDKLPKQITPRSGDLWPPGSLSFEQVRT